MDQLKTELQELFKQVFGDGSIVLDEAMTAADIEGWDSLMHINLIIAVEKRFKIKFATAEISGLKADGQTVGSFLSLIARKLGPA
jgi:acyl carrier protein